MIECANVRLPLDAGLPDDAERLMCKAAARVCGVDAGEIAEVRLLRRSVDARRKSDVHFVATLGVRLVDAAAEQEGVSTSAYARAALSDKLLAMQR